MQHGDPCLLHDLRRHLPVSRVDTREAEHRCPVAFEQLDERRLVAGAQPREEAALVDHGCDALIRRIEGRGRDRRAFARIACACNAWRVACLYQGMAVSELSPLVARDQHLIVLMASGEESAFREFYERHARTALSLASRVLRDRSLAEDAVQEAFLAAWRQAGSYRPSRGKPASWLLTFVHRRAVDHVRRQQRCFAEPLELDLLGLAADDEAVTGMPTRAWIRTGLDRLSAPDREILELAYLDDLTQVEIAAHLGTPLGTIKSRTSTALRRLNKSLAA